MEVPIRFRQLGRRNVPTIEFHARVSGQSARLSEFALVDTGSAFTILARRLLKLNRFDLSRAKELKGGVYSVGGTTRTWYLEKATLSLIDSKNQIHQVNLPRLFFTESEMPPIFGREALRAFNGVLTIDFIGEHGALQIG